MDSSHNYTNFAVPYGTKKTVNGVDYYMYDDPYEGGYYCHDNGKYFYFSSSVDINGNNGRPLEKVYVDDKFYDADGKLYLFSEKGGWYSVGSHKYYFRQSDKSAVCGKTAKIGGIVYLFSRNGVCKGRFTGYVKSGGKKVYYRNGIRVKECLI